MPRKNRKRWLCLCWQCGEPFEATRETAMLCSAACRKQRSRFHVANGHFPPRKEGVAFSNIFIPYSMNNVTDKATAEYL